LSDVIISEAIWILNGTWVPSSLTENA